MVLTKKLISHPLTISNSIIKARMLRLENKNPIKLSTSFIVVRKNRNCLDSFVYLLANSDFSKNLYQLPALSKDKPLVLEMNRKENLNTSYNLNHEFISGGSCRFLEPCDNLFSSPETNARDYASHGQELSQQPHQSGYPKMPDPTTQLMQSAIQQDLHYNTTNSLQPITGLYGETKAYPDYLQSKPPSELLYRNPNMGKMLRSSWRDLAGPEIKEEHQYLNPWTGSTAVEKIVQSGGPATGKQRIRWTHELHMEFVEVVKNLGGAMKATPKGILKLMKSPGLTIFQIKSHLQKYRTAKNISDHVQGKSEKKANQDVMSMPSHKGEGGFHISEALCLQMDVQKSLHEHLEFQRKLQVRIEEHANYLQKMFEQQEKNHGFFASHNSGKSIDPSVAESSSTGGYGENN